MSCMRTGRRRSWVRAGSTSHPSCKQTRQWALIIFGFTTATQMSFSNYIRRRYVQAHHYCRKYKVHSNMLCLSEWTLNVPPINLLSFWILSTILVVLQSFVIFLLYLLIVYLFIHLFTYLYCVCVSWLSFCLSFSLSGVLAYVCCACHIPAHNEWWHCTTYYCCLTVAACVVVLWPQSLYL